jgi:hypothetical protein
LKLLNLKSKDDGRARVAALITSTTMILLLSFLALAPGVSAAPTSSVIRLSGPSFGSVVCIGASCPSLSTCTIPAVPASVISEETSSTFYTDTYTDTGVVSMIFSGDGYLTTTSDGGAYDFECATGTGTIDGSPVGTMTEDCESSSTQAISQFVCNSQDLVGTLGVQGGGLYTGCIPVSTCSSLPYTEWAATYSDCDWSGTLSPGSNLAGCNLPGVNFAGANLRGDNMARANFAGATSLAGDSLPFLVTSATLAGASLQGANLNGADLQGVSLASANLAGANLHDANLNGADLTNADFAGANCQGATDVGATGTSTTITTGSNHCP